MKEFFSQLFSINTFPHFINNNPIPITDKIYDKIITSVEKKAPLRQAYYKQSLRKAIKNTREIGDLSKHKFHERPVWKSVRETLGLDNLLLLLVSAATPLDSVLELFRFLVPNGVFAVYGLVETSGLAAITPRCNAHLRHVGLPAALELQLESLRLKVSTLSSVESSPRTNNEHNKYGDYKSDAMGDGVTGEVLLRGASVFCGYLDETNDLSGELSFDFSKKHDSSLNSSLTALESGWLRTGDVGRLNPNKTLSVLFRMEDPFEMALGERVNPERAEFVYSACAAVHQVFVCGGREEKRAVAIVVPAVNWCLKKLKEEEDSKGFG